MTTSIKNDNNTKIWIGNIDCKVSEYQLLKIAQTFGKIISYDFLYNVSEKGSRMPRGYAFVTYASKESAEKAIHQLDRKKVLNRELHVRYANASSKSKNGVPGTSQSLPSILCAGGSKTSKESDREAKIRQLEAKLKSLEDSNAS